LAQLLGAFLGSVLIWVHYLPHWKETKDLDLKFACFATTPGISSTWPNLVSEMLGTFALILCILTIGANKFTQGLNPLIVGFLIIALGLSLGGTTGYAINPARDLDPRIAHFLLPIAGKGQSNWKYAWIPVMGPIIGGTTGALFYQAVFLQKVSFLFWIFLCLFLFVIAIAIRHQFKKGNA